jgi:uncharacterized protein YfaP (DUF2135 family)
MSEATSHATGPLAGWHQAETSATLATVQEYHRNSMMLNDKARTSAKAHGDVRAMFH